MSRQRGRLERPAALRPLPLPVQEIGDEHGVADHWWAPPISPGSAGLRHRRALYLQAQARFAALGNRYGVARGTNGQGEVARLRGDLGRAVDLYRGALTLLARLSSADEIFPRVNLALVALAGGDFVGAAAVLEESRETLAAMGWGGLHVAVRAALLPCAARARDWKAWDEGFDFVTAALRETGLREPDIAWAAALAAEVADAAGEGGRAEAAREMGRSVRTV